MVEQITQVKAALLIPKVENIQLSFSCLPEVIGIAGDGILATQLHLDKAHLGVPLHIGYSRIKMLGDIGEPLDFHHRNLSPCLSVDPHCAAVKTPELQDHCGNQ